MQKVYTVVHAGICIGLLVELLGLMQIDNSNWQVLILGLAWVLVSQLRLFFIKQDVLQRISFFIDIFLMGICIFFLHQAPLMGLVLTGLSTLSIFKSPYFQLGINGVMIVLFLLGRQFCLEAWLLVGTLIGLGYLLRLLGTELNKLEAQRIETSKQLALLNHQLAANQADLMSIQQEYIQVERQRISRDLHDSVGHSLSTIIVQLGAMAKLSEETSPAVSLMATRLKEFASQGLQEVRQVIHDLKPNHLNEDSIIKGLEGLFASIKSNSSLKIEFRYNQLAWEPNPIQYQTLYRACQESLSNAQKHGKAITARVFLMITEQELVLTIQDDGQGCQSINPHMGLASIEQRVEALGGHVHYQSQPEAGFMTRIDLPRVKEVTK